MSIDFRADQIRTNKVIASGSTGTNAGILFYSVVAASDLRGGINTVAFNTGAIGTDVFFYVSGGIKTNSGTAGARSVFGGDVFFSGSIYFQSGSWNIFDTQGTSAPIFSLALTSPATSNTTILTASSMQWAAAAGIERSDNLTSAGGSLTLNAGTGGAAVNALTGSVGGSVVVVAGYGGAGSGALNAGGIGGSITQRAGYGGTAIGGVGGVGGSASYYAGNGGNSFSSNGGNGGSLYLKAGSGGISNIGLSGSGGNLFLAAGSGSINGTIYIGSGSILPTLGRDVSVFVSGSPSSLGTSTKGVALFGGDTAVSGAFLGMGSVLGLYPGATAGGITASLASNLVSFGMQYQTQFAVRDKLDQNWMTVFLYADEGSKFNNLYIGDFINGAFGGGNPLNKSIKFYVSGATATGQTPFARFDAVTGSFISGSTIFVGGMSGSLQRLRDGTPAFVPGGGVTITTQSNGAIAISASAIVQRTNLAALGTSTQVSSSYQVMGRFYYDPTEWNITGKQFYWKAIFASSDNLTTASVAFYNATIGTGSYIAINGVNKLTTVSSTPGLLTGSTNGAVANFDPSIAALIEVHASVSSSATTNLFSMAELVVK